MRCLTILIFLWALSFEGAFSAVKNDTLYLNNGTVNIANNNYHYLSFNNTTNDTIRNDALFFSEDTLNLTIYNLDTLTHTPFIDDFNIQINPIPPGSNYTYQLDFSNSEGNYRFYCQDNIGNYLGASTNLIKKISPNYSYYSWNLYDQEAGLDTAILNNNVNNLPILGYLPSVFTINGNIHPNTMNDTLAHVSNSVGDTIIINIINSGKMDHTLHFHGYHVKILTATKKSGRINWSKDTFPVIKGESMSVMLVPHQPGDYPVHNHNLVAVNTGGYPGGMITMLNILP